MQFEPGTFAAYSRPVPAGGADPPDPYDPRDTTFAAARLLCANGGGRADRLQQAVFAYNHSDAYVAEVLGLAGALAATNASAGEAALVAVQFALGQVGIPYGWGAEDPGVAFDCSGLVQAAWAAAGVKLPGWRKTSSTPDRCCPRASRSSLETWCSSGPRVRGSPMLVSSWMARVTWWTLRTAALRSGWSRFP